MNTLYATLGISGSGKSTWAAELVAASDGKVKRVNKDLLRTMMDADVWSKQREKEIMAVQDLLMRRWLKAGYDVVCDNTNIGWEDRLASLAKECGAAFELVDFRHVSIEECIRRDIKRAGGVGEKVIRDQAKRLFGADKQHVEPPPHIEGAPTATVFDIDGTLAIMNGRKPYAWGEVGTDLPNPPVIKMANLIHNSGETVILVSGRDAVCRLQTRIWLKEHVGEWTQDSPLFMRPEKDNRKDVIVKAEIYERELKGKYNISQVYDDRSQVVQGWRDLGIPCYQVAPGDF